MRMVSRTLLSLLGLGLAVRGEPSLRTESGSIIASVDKSTGADFGVVDTATGIKETWGDVKGDIRTVNQMLGITRRQGPAAPADPTSGRSLPSLVADMIIKLDEVKNASQANHVDALAAAQAANAPFFTVAYPDEVTSVGGDMVKIGGYNFIPGIPIYTATWTYTDSAGSTIIVETMPTAATSTSLLAVEAPAWPHLPVQTEYIATLTLMQKDQPVPSLTSVVTTFQAQGPTMTDFQGSLQANSVDITGTAYRFNITVDDADTDAANIVVAATFTNSSFVSSINDISRAPSSERVIEVIFPGGARGCGTTNVTFTVTDNLGLSSNQTITLFIDCDNWVTIVRTANSRSNYGTFGRGVQAMSRMLRTDTGTNIGAFSAINTYTGAQYIRITKLDGRNAGEFATFRFVAPLARSMLATILGCGATNSYTSSVSTTQWTSRYSGTKVAGNLPLYNRYNQRQSLRYMFICGINTSSDDDHSVLAFTYRLGYSNDWSDSWRGTNQRGTVWSLYNDDYRGGRGWNSVQSGPGYKAGSYNAGGYKIDLSDRL